MKILKWLGGLILLLVLLLFGGALLLSPKFSVTRSVVISAPPDKIFGLIEDPRRWKEWSVWNRRDPAMQITYTGPPKGQGAAWAWTSKTEGDGRMTFTAAEPAQRLAYDLHIPDFGTTSSGDLRLAPDGAATRVSWSIQGDMGSTLLYRWFALFAGSMTGKDFDAGLANLKALAEKP